MKNIEHLLKWTCPRCGDQVYPILGHTIVADGNSIRAKCSRCEPPKEVAPTRDIDWRGSIW